MNLLEMRIGALVGFGASSCPLPNTPRSTGRIVQIFYSPSARSHNLIVESGGKLVRVNGRRARFISGPIFRNPETLWVHPWPFSGYLAGIQRHQPIRIPLASREEFEFARYLTFERSDVRRIDEEVLAGLSGCDTWEDWTGAARRLRDIYLGIDS